ncbi:MAG: TPM domain-containing protein [Desulfobacterales bacterium]|nr:TPM domain-containing protein [Desulfobacterales bacterium]
MKRVRRIVLLVSSICVVAAACAWAAIPATPQGWVSDFSGIIADTTKTQIDALCADVKKSTGAEIAVVTVPSLDGMSVEEYAVKLFEKWGIGEKDKDNGVLFLIAPNERKTRIEVGYGLETVITDGRAGEIIRETIIPFFKAGDYNQGILQGSMQIAALITGKDFVPSVPIPSSESRSDEPPWPIKVVIILFFALFITLGFLALGSSLRRKGQSFFRIWGAGFGGIPLLMSIAFALAMGFPVYILPAWAVIMLLTGMRYGKKFARAGLFSGGSFSAGGKGFSSSGSSSSSSSGGFSGGSSFGGFSGGSSGGGGSSGSW